MINIKDVENISDSEITSRVLGGDIAVYEIIIRRYNPYLFKIGRSFGFNQQDTEDLMQETFINAYTNLSKFENRSSLKTWLVRIMLNQCYHAKQKVSYKNEFPSNYIEKTNKSPMFTQKPMNPSETFMNNELKHILEDAIVKIPEKYRMVFTLRELNGMNIKETAHALDLSQSNVKVRLNRAKAMLQAEIRKLYSPEEIFEFNLIYCNRIVENVFKRLPQKTKSTTFFNLINLKISLQHMMSRPNGKAS